MIEKLLNKDLRLAANTRLARESLAHILKTRMRSVGNISNYPNICVYSGIGCAFSPALADPNSGEFTHGTHAGSSAKAIINLAPHLLKPWAVDCDAEFALSVQKCHDSFREFDGHPEHAFVDYFTEGLRALCLSEGVAFPDDLLEAEMASRQEQK